MFDDIPAPVFIVIGIVMAIFSTVISLKTSFIKFIFFFIAAAILIAFGVMRIIMAGDDKKKANWTPPPMPNMKQQPFNRAALDGPLPAPSYPRPEPLSRGQPLPQMNYQPRPAMPQQRQNPQISASRYKGIYQGQGQEQKSRFHDRVRQQ
ncbi:MAG: hypothetical protein EPN86_00420 [Nanoarchaeota archaeon]|nr:MAG: hypothetical protein EPN86_00420 [Nanoarchaeota archaeon]